MSNSSKKWNWGFKGKTGFDLIQLFLFPLLLALVGSSLPVIQQRIADERYREEALQSYYKDMRELMLEKKLRVSNSRDEVRSIARARTLSVLRQLDTQRKGLLTLFLKESDLITLKTVKMGDEEKPAVDRNGELVSQAGIVSMSGANLESTNLKDMDLRFVSFWYTRLTKAQLKGANLIYANLRHANLSNANLEGANLDNADLGSANLSGANLDNASMQGTKFCETIMSDGTVRNDNCE